MIAVLADTAEQGNRYVERRIKHTGEPKRNFRVFSTTRSAEGLRADEWVFMTTDQRLIELGERSAMKMSGDVTFTYPRLDDE